MEQEINEPLYRKCYSEALKCDFITHKWEARLYAACLYEAELWGEEKDRENREYYKKNHLVDKYKL